MADKDINIHLRAKGVEQTKEQLELPVAGWLPGVCRETAATFRKAAAV